MKKKKTEGFLFKQARKLRSYATPKLLLAHSLTGVNCRATSIAKKGKVSFFRNLTLQCNLSEIIKKGGFCCKREGYVSQGISCCNALVSKAMSSILVCTASQTECPQIIQTDSNLKELISLIFA